MFVVENMASKYAPEIMSLIMQNGIEKISLSKCKSVLQKDGSVYTDDEILEVRNFLYKLAEMDYDVFLKLKTRELEFEKLKETENDNSEIKNAA